MSMNTFFDIHLSKKDFEYYNTINIFLHILYIVLILGVAFVNIIYVHYLIIIVHLFICIFLMVKFNPFRNGGVLINEYEKKFIFSGSVILLINIIIYEIGIKIDVDKMKTRIDNYKEWLFSLL
jgi:hypothetical protein